MGSIKKQPGSVNFQNSLTIKDLRLDVSCYFWLLWRSKYNAKRDQKDDKDLVTVHPFVPEGRRNAFVNYNNGQKGYIAAFAAKNESDDELITKIQANAYFQRLTDSSELICVAVDV